MLGVAAGDLAAWQRIAWWEGPDAEGHLWLMIDFRAAVSASRTHGPELVARILVSNVSAFGHEQQRRLKQVVHWLYDTWARAGGMRAGL
jgi:hypothetical protein